MKEDVYSLTLASQTLSHGFPGWFFGDHDLSVEELELNAQVRSGDYFETLASQLDDICKDLAESDDTNYVILEAIIKNLLYLQKTHTIVKK